MGAYQELMDFRADLERRAWELRGQEQKLTTELAGMEAGLDEAIIQGDHHHLQEQIEKKRAELAPLQREIQVLENPPPGGKLKDLVRAVWQEATDEITGALRAEWEAKATELEKLKRAFLVVVGEMGQVKRRADSTTSRATEVMLGVGGKLAVPSLATGVISRPDRKEGAIYINPLEIEKTFNGRN